MRLNLAHAKADVAGSNFLPRLMLESRVIEVLQCCIVCVGDYVPVIMLKDIVSSHMNISANTQKQEHSTLLDSGEGLRHHFCLLGII